MFHHDSALDPHGSGPILTAGPSPTSATVTLILLHDRGGSAANMLGLFNEINSAGNVALSAVIPQADHQMWYPRPVQAPLDENQPWLDSGLTRVDTIFNRLLSHNIDSRRVVIGGFSQGACLAAEYAARHPRRYGGVIILAGGLFGPSGNLPRYSGNLNGTPVFLGSADPEPNVPFKRVEETATVFREMGADVEVRRYPRMPHSINSDELEACRSLVQVMAATPADESDEVQPPHEWKFALWKRH